MEFSWSTFLLEILNFLVLVWILKHFLFQPVLAVIRKRQAGIDAQLAESQRLHEESTALKSDYEHRLNHWEQERQQARMVLTKSLDAERATRLEQLKRSIEEEKEKFRVAESRRQQETRREIEHQAMQQSAQFAAILLRQAAGPELEARLLARLLDDLSQLSEDQVAALQLQWGEVPEVIAVTSAYPISDKNRQALTQALQEVCNLSVPVEFAEDPQFIAGVCITIGAWRLHANLRDELKGFAEFAYVTR
ncbi:F0F1 ATP synthase subunit delta [Photobacterium sp. MCCC 1A19761]|uniref:F0F1 ATP synthase subunit delta n=1 Tax=Photobacterium sp. MCCC 1A19761 TaxID=3115000 RepID=UPI00307D3DFF